MFDIGWQELFVIAVITIIVVGPKEIPRVLRTVTHWVRKIREMAREFQSSIDDIAREAELDDIKQQLAAAKDFDFEQEMKNAIDPDDEISSAIHEMREPVDEAKSIAEDTARSAEQAAGPSDEDPATLPDGTRAAGS